MFCKVRFAVLATVAVVLLSAALSASGTTWDPAAQWSITNGNPNGDWTYGWLNQLGGTFSTAMAPEDRGSVQVWVGAAPSDAGVIMNSGADWIGSLAPGQASLHPGSNGAMPVYRWTATGTTFVDVQATYNGCSNVTTTDVHVILNGTSVFDGVIDGYSGTPPDFLDVVGPNPTQQYGGILAVNSGDKIDFAVGMGNGFYFSDLTGIVASITTLTDVGTLSGTVKDSFDTPIVGATISVDGLTYTTKSGTNGSYTLLLPTGTYDVQAAKTGYESQVLSATITTGDTTVTNFALGNVKVAGTVLSSLTGNPPLVAATVKATDGSGGVVASTTTGSDGGYAMSLLPGYYLIEASFPGYETGYAEAALWTAGQSTDASFVLNLVPGDSWDAVAEFGSMNPSNVWSYGYVTTLNGPFTFYTDYFYAPLPTGGLGGWVIGNPDAQGSVIQNISEDPYDGNPYYWEANQLTPHPGPDGRMATVRWTAPRPISVKVETRFTGQMMDLTTTDVHVAKSGVSMFDGAINGFVGTVANGFTDASGTSPAQSYTGVTQVVLGDTIDFVVGPGPGQNQWHDLTGLTATISAISQVGTLTGRVTAGVSGNPGIPGAVVTTVEVPYAATTAADGSFTLPMEPGIYTLRVGKPGFPTVEVPGVTITNEGTTTRNVTLAAGIIGGTVSSDPAGVNPINGAVVAIPGSAFTATTGPDGVYSLLVGPGTYDLTATASGYLSASRSGIEVTSGQSVDLDIVMEVGWDLGADFSGQTNPSGTWTYGYLNETGQFTALTATIDFVGVPAWYDGSYTAIVWKDTLATPWTDGYGYAEPGGVTLHPGPFNGYRAVARWTAPSAVDIRVDARFTGQTINLEAKPDGTTSDVHVMKNGASVLDANVVGFIGSAAQGYTDRSGPSPEQTYQAYMSLAAGGTVDFVVGPGSDGTPESPSFCDATGLAVTIVVAPAPPSYDLSTARGLADGAAVSITSAAAVTSASGTFADGGYYIETPDRCAGTKAVGGGAVALGDRVTLSGTMATDANGEKYISVSGLTGKTTGQPIREVGVVQKSLTGLPGMLVRVWGNVTSSDAATGIIYLEDGSGLTGGSSSGVKVSIADLVGFTGTETLPALGTFCVVTGIVGLDDSELVVRPRTALEFMEL